MTEKRFTYEYDEYNGNLFDNKMNTFYHIEDSDENIEVLCDRLNWLVEENEELKTKNRGLESELQIFKKDVEHSNLQMNKLADENKQLKKQSKELFYRERDTKNEWRTLKKENEQLKSENKKLEQLNAKYLKDLIYFQETYKTEEVGSECSYK